MTTLSTAELGPPMHSRLAGALARRTAANAAFFEREAERVARLCHAMAGRFSRGGRLVALGASPQARSDARHIAVEFVHPVIVGKRALPALALAAEGGPLVRQVESLAGPEDIAVAFGIDEQGASGDESAAAVEAARARGCLTVAFPEGGAGAGVGARPKGSPGPVPGGSAESGAEWVFQPPGDDPFVRQELVETLYHVVWELVHVFFEHRGLLEGRAAAPVHDPGGSGFLYPFLRQAERDLDGVLGDVRASVLLKATEVAELRAAMLAGSEAALLSAAATLRDSLAAGGALLAFGNGGSATDAMDVVADFRWAPQGWPARRALDLTEDPSILTAIANDVGLESVFARQIIAYGKPGDVALALSTSGNSRNIVRALEEARRRGLRTVALVGYDGGRILAERLADHVVVAPSQHIPRIQEAQATAYHLLRELVEA